MSTAKEKTISAHKPTSGYKIGQGYKAEKVDQKNVRKWSVDQKKNKKKTDCGEK